MSFTSKMPDKQAGKGISMIPCCMIAIAAGIAIAGSSQGADQPGQVNDTLKSKPILAAKPVSDGSISPGSALDRPVTDKWALIIGISNFDQPTIPRLRYAAKDAQDFRDFLVNQAHFAPDHVRLLLNEKATRKQILSSFDKFLGRVARKDDLVLVYFSTHGSPETSDARGQSYLVTYDADKDDLFASSIPMSDITDLVKSRINSERVVLVMDTCFSGASAGGKGIDEVGNVDAQKLAQGTGKLVICSSSPSEKSWESKRYKNGIFTRKLIDALSLHGAETRLGRAFSSISEEVQNEVREDYGLRQQPVLAKASWTGEDLMLAARPANPREIPAAVKDILDPDSNASPETGSSRSLLRETSPLHVESSSAGPSTPNSSTTTPNPAATPTQLEPGAAASFKQAAPSPTAPSHIVPSQAATGPAAPAKMHTVKTGSTMVKAGRPQSTKKSSSLAPATKPPPVAPLWTRSEPGR